MIESLSQKIEDKTARLAVIGLGYVGLPVACKFAEAGFHVTGVDIKAERVARINAGQNPIEGKEPGLAELLTRVTGGRRLQATTDYAALREVDIVLISVETPVDDSHTPRYEALRAALTSLGAVLKQGALVIIESTIAPGTMSGLVIPTLEQTSGFKVNQDFFAGNCPERVMPGRLLANLTQMSRVVGGMTPATSAAMVKLYRNVVQAELDPVDSVTAELVKTAENAYRDVQIAFANELAMICEVHGANVWQVRELVNKSPGRHVHLPGAGVGGHCIPKDPWLLAHAAPDALTLKLLPAARAVNEGMPKHMADIVVHALTEAGQNVSQTCVGVLGYAYLENSDDTRNSPTASMVAHLHALVSEITIHDPWVKEFRGDIYQVMEGMHVLVLMVKHEAYRNLDFKRLREIMRTPILIDGRGFFDSEKITASGFVYFGLGRGK